ncbi:MAG: hypothetical protein KBD06_05375 [Candidatus Pacebacteria bacterium]|nr:hypothetical protein [Candidatus Paceibacterota bacterium]
MSTENNQATPAPLPEAWITFITPFADVLGKPVLEVSEMLAKVVGQPGDQAIALLQDSTLSPDTDIKGALNGTPSAVANAAIKKLRADTSMHSPTALALGLDVLPPVPAEDSWLNALRAGGILKVDESSVISAIRVALADRVNLYDIPDTLAKRMEAFADENAEPVPEEFFKIRKQLTRRNYAEIFEAIDGLDGNFVTEARKNQLLSRINTSLWPALVSFHAQLKAWVEAWQQGAANPAMMMNAMLAISGAGAAAMPPGMMQPPDTGALRDQGLVLNDEINKVFAGTGIQIAAALAYDASRIKTLMENPRLPGMIGANNRDQMLKQLRVEVSAAYPRLETNLTRYVLSVLSLKNLPAGNDELQFFSSLYMLGSQIPWADLDMGRRGKSFDSRGTR